MSSLGFDVGTYNLVCARRNENGTEINYTKEINAYIELDLQNQNKAFFNIVKGRVPIIERGDKGYIFGQAALDMALAMPKLELKRPMSGGCLNPKEKDSFKILQLMCHSMVGRDIQDKEVIYYCVPANAVNAETDSDFHREVLHDVFKSYNIGGKKLTPYHMNEAMAIIYAELADKQFTGIAVSAGSGMINFCYSMYATEVCSFSIVNSGDWIDQQAAKACGETPVFVNRAKHKIDLNKDPVNEIEQAIKIQYKLMVDHTVMNIKQALQRAENKIQTDQPIDIIVAGGTSSPPGFVEMFKEAIDNARLPIPIGNIRKPDDHLYTVARGLLVAAEASQ